jgi:hypothetical protein
VYNTIAFFKDHGREDFDKHATRIRNVNNGQEMKLQEGSWQRRDSRPMGVLHRDNDSASLPMV